MIPRLPATAVACLSLLAASADACPFHAEWFLHGEHPALPVLWASGGDGDAGADLFLSRSRQLTFDGARTGEGYFSLDGNLLVFQSEREPGNPWYQIYLMDLDTGDTERLSPGHGKTTCAYIDPTDSGRVLYASTHEDPRSLDLQREELEFRASGKERRYSWDYDPHFDIFIHDRATGESRNITNATGYDAEGAFSRDGRTIVFSSNRAAYSDELTSEQLRLREVDPAFFADIYLMDADGSNVRRMTDAPGYDGGPFFSYDGSLIVWRRFAEDGVTADVWVADADGTNQRRVTDFGAMNWAPFLHPSNDYIIFTSNKLGFANFELFIVDRAGTREPVRVTHTDGFDGLPVFSPDGRQLVWTTNRRGASQLFMAGWDHEAALRALAEAPLRASNDI